MNVVARKPRTISQIAKELGLSSPSVHAHVAEMLINEILCESEESEKLHSKERYYKPNFPVVRFEDRLCFSELCQKMSGEFVETFEKARPRFEKAFAETNLTEQGWEFTDLTQYFYACIHRSARKMLEERGTLHPPEQHQNGAEWVFWAEEAETNGHGKA